MKDFLQWLDERGIELNEKGKRTALSANYPSLYHSIRQQPRQTWTPISATAPLADKQIGPDEKVTNGGPNVTEKKDNPYKSFYSTEWSKFLDKKVNEIAPALLAVGRAALPHVAKGAGMAAANKVMQPKQQMKKHCRSMMHDGKKHRSMMHDGKKHRSMMHDGDKPWMKTKGHPGKYNC